MGNYDYDNVVTLQPKGLRPWSRVVAEIGTDYVRFIHGQPASACEFRMLAKSIKRENRFYFLWKPSSGFTADFEMIKANTSLSMTIDLYIRQSVNSIIFQERINIPRVTLEPSQIANNDGWRMVWINTKKKERESITASEEGNDGDSDIKVSCIPPGSVYDSQGQRIR